MNDQKAILEAYLSEGFAAKGLTLDAKTLQVINEHVQLVARDDESQETRSITQSVDSSGKHQATSFKLVNIARMSTEDILGFVGKYAGITMFEDTAKKIIYAFVMLLIDFYPKLKIEFSEQEAQVIYAIAQLKKKSFTLAEAQQAYNANFLVALPEEKLKASLKLLTTSYVLETSDNQLFQLRERIKNLSR